MPTIINPLITDAGLTAAINASAASLQLAITHIALGSGQYTPAVGQTALTNRKEKITVAGGFVSGTGGFRVNAVFPAWAGVPNPYNATEIGFYAGDPDSDGVLFAVYSHPSNVIVQRNALDYVAQFGLQLSRVPAGSVTVTIDPGASQALALLSTHEAATDPHAPYASRAQISEIMTAAGLSPDFTTVNKLLTALRSAGVFQTAALGDNSTKAATTAFFQANSLGGAGQAYQNVTGSRTIGTTYTNSTGRPIFIAATGTHSGANAVVGLLINGVFMNYSSSTPSAGGGWSCGFPVPPGATYTIALATAGTPVITWWAELR